MTDERKYIVSVGDQSEIWDSDMYAQKGDSLYATHKDANVFELEDVEGFDEDPTDKQYLINLGGEAEVWDADMVKEKGARLKQVYPDVAIQRINWKDYWGEQAKLNRERKAELEQPDVERNARLAEIGYYDDISGEAFTYEQTEEGVPQYGPAIGLKPLSSVVSQSPVTGATTYSDPAVENFFADDTYADRQAEIARLDAEYEENPSVIAEREWRAQMLKEQAEYRNSLRDSINTFIDEEVDLGKAGRGFAGTRVTTKYGMSPYVPSGEEQAELEKREKATTALKLLEKADILSNVKEEGFWGATGNTLYEKTLDAVTQDDVQAYNQIGDILSNLSEQLKKEGLNLEAENLTEEVFDKYLSTEDKNLILAFFEYNSAAEQAGKDMSKAYKGGKIFAESIPFMLEFLATGGFYKAAGSAATKGLAGALKRWVVKAAKGSVKRTLRKGASLMLKNGVYALVGTAARTAVAPSTYTRMAEKSVEIGKDGELHRAKNMAIGFFDSYIENLSEVSGGMIGKALGAPLRGVKLLGKTAKGAAIASRLGSTTFAQWGKMLGSTKFAKGLSTAYKSVMPKMKSLGFHGLPEEVGEEYIGNAIRSITIDPNALKNMHEDGNFGAMIIGFAPMTLLGVAGGAATVAATNIQAAKYGDRMREMLGGHYNSQQVEHMIGGIVGAESPEQMQDAIDPMIEAVKEAQKQGKISEAEAEAEIKSIYNYSEWVAKNKALMFAKQTRDNELAADKKAQIESQYGKFWQDGAEGAQTVQVATLNDGRTVFVTSQPAADGKITTLDAKTKAWGFAYATDIAESQTYTMDAYINGEIAKERKTREQVRMDDERNAQIKALKSGITEGTEINLGTDGAPAIMLATGKTTSAGVEAIAPTGERITIGWEQAADALGKPIIVKTDQQLIDEQTAAIVKADAERRAKRQPKSAATQVSEQTAAEVTDAVAQEEKHIPTLPDGTVDESAFWKQDPEGYAKWNDEQNQDGGADTREQIEAEMSELQAMLKEQEKLQKTSNPSARKEAKVKAGVIMERMMRLNSLAVEYEIAEKQAKWENVIGSRIVHITNEQELAEISSAAAREMKAGARVRGFYQDGQAYMYLPGLVEAEEYDEAFIHEVLGHYGLRQMLGADFNRVLQNVWSLMSEQSRNFFLNYPGVKSIENEAERQLAAADEYIAHIAEKMSAGELMNTEEKSIWQKIVETIKGWFAKKGVGEDVMTEEYIQDLIRDSYAFLAERKGEELAPIKDTKRTALSAVEQEYETLAQDLTAEEIKAVASNEFNASQNAYNDIVASEPTVNEGESARDFIARKKAYREQVEAAKADLEAKQALMDEVAKREQPVQPAQSNEEPSTFMEIVDEQEPAIRFSVKTEDYLKEQIRDYANSKEGKKAGWTAEQMQTILEETGALIEAIHNSSTGNEFYDEFAKKDPTIRVDWRDGVAKPIVTWTRANIEYKYDMSADLLCINNEALEDVLSSPAMVELMEKFNVARTDDVTRRGADGKMVEVPVDIRFTPDDYLELYNTLKDMGFVVPCKGCFDAAGRFKMLPSIAQKFADEVNAVIDERNSNPEAFDAALRAKKGDKTVSGLPAAANIKNDAIRVGVAGDNLTEHIKWTQLMSADGQTKMLSDWGGIFRAWQRTGAGRPKDKLLPEPYYGDIVSQQTTIIAAYGAKTPSFRDILVNKGTGLRRNSHSEFRPVLAIDEIQFMRDAFIKNLTVFKYMKEIDDVRLFGKLGVKFNMSFFPAFVEGAPAAGLDKDGNYIASEESVGAREFPYYDEEGVKHYDGMKGWAEAQKYVNKDVSLSSVIFSYPHLIKALTDVPTVEDKAGLWGSLIPFHSSGATTSSLRAQGLGEARANDGGPEELLYDYDKGVSNFEGIQNDRFGKGWVVVEGTKAGKKVDEGHKLEWAAGTHYYNKELGLHLFKSAYILDSELPEGIVEEDGHILMTKDLRKQYEHDYEIDYNNKVRELGTTTAYKDAADYYLDLLPKLGLIPRFDFAVPENIFLQMCEDAKVDPMHPKLGWKGEGHEWTIIDSPAYYALFCDYGMTDPATGEWSPHRPVGVVKENGERVFEMPENTVEIVREGLGRYAATRRAEQAKTNEAIRSFAKRSVASGRISEEAANSVLEKIDAGEYATEGPDLRFSVIGEVGALSDKTKEGVARLENLEVARQMEQALNPDWKAKEDEAALKIKVATGWERGADGLWRYEVEDVMIKPLDEWLDKKTKLKLKDIVRDGEVMRLYPDLADITIVKMKSKTDLGAAYNSMNNTIKLPFGAVRSALDAYRARPLREELNDLQAAVAQMYLDVLHEVQHAIQNREGFARGGNSKTMADPQRWREYRALRKEHSELIDQYNKLIEQYYAIPESERRTNPEAARLLDEMNVLDAEIDRVKTKMDSMISMHSVGKAGYKKLAGEVESRNVEGRIMMPEEQRRNTLLASTEDVAREDQIFINYAFEQAESAVRFSVRTDEQREQLFDAAKKEFGTTDNFNVAGYMLPDGSLLNFGDPANPTTRAEDHRAIEGVIVDEGKEYEHRWQYLADFMNEGAIRLLPEYAGINLMHAPTAEQRKRLFDFIYKYNGEVILEIADDRLNNVAYVEYDRRTSPARIFRDIDGYFNNGIIPQQDIRFSVANESQAIFVSNAAKAVEGIKMEKATPAQWLAMIEKNGGLKAGEDKWMGLSDWLKASDKKTLTKQEVLDFIGEHMIQIEEVHYGEASEERERATYENLIKEKGKEFADSLIGEAFIYDEGPRGPRLLIEDIRVAARLYQQDTGNELAIGRGVWTKKDEDTLMEWAQAILAKASEIDGEREIDSTRLHYSTEGLENKHEIALTVPTVEPWKKSRENTIHFEDAGEGRAVAWIRFGDTEVEDVSNEQKGRQLRKANEDAVAELDAYTKSLQDKYGEDNLFELRRLATKEELERGKTLSQKVRETDGKYSSWLVYERNKKSKVLVIDEIQSARHQEGREKGYSYWDETVKEVASKTGFSEDYIKENPYDVANWMDAHANSEEGRALAQKLREEFDKSSEGIPAAPFEKNWHELAMKRMLRYAAENGYDAIAWLKGEQQAERYKEDYKKVEVAPWKTYDTTKVRAVRILFNDGGTLYFGVNDKGVITRGDFAGENLSEVLGKEFAQKILSIEGEAKLSGEELTFGDGMKGFYDKMLPAFMNKYGKKWGIKVSDMELPNLEGGLTMHSIPVTEEMKESVMGGQVMFSAVTPHQSSLEEVSEMFYQWNKDEDLVPLFERVKEICAMFDTDFKIVSAAEMRSIAQPGVLGVAWGSKVRYNVNLFKYYGDQTKAGAILHEMIHVATVYLMSTADKQTLTAGQLQARADLRGILMDVREALSGAYGAINEMELVAEMANASFRDQLKKGNLWERLVNAIRRLLGFDQKDYDRLTPTMHALERLLETPNVELKKELTPTSDDYLRFSAVTITPEVREEMYRIAANAIIDGNYMLAPNGQPTKLTADQWALVRTQNFINWFGDWINDPENASKVVDENGEPMVVYHGTRWNPYDKPAGEARFVSGWFTGVKRRAEGFGEPVAAFLNLRNPAFSYDGKAKEESSILPDAFDLNNPKTFGEYDGYISYVDYPAVATMSKIGEMRIKMLHPDNYEEVIKEMLAAEPTGRQIFSAIPRYPNQIKSATETTGEFSESEDIRFSVRTKPAPKKTGIGYKVFYLKDGKLYPPMVANLGGVDTPVLIWLDADAAPVAGQSKTGRTQVKAGGKGTQGGSGTLAYRPGWHLGEIPYALQFNRKDENGEKTLFPANFVWAEVEYADDVDYQEEAMSYGINANGNFQHSLAGLPKVPTDGAYRYRTNPNPETDPWIITGAMRVKRLLTPSEVDQMVIAAGRQPQKRQEGAVTDEQINALNKSLGMSTSDSGARFSAVYDPVKVKAAKALSKLDAIGMDFESQFAAVRDEIDAVRNLVKNLNSVERTPSVIDSLKACRDRLEVLEAEMDMLRQVQDQMLDTDPVSPDYDRYLSSREPQSIAEYLADLFTMRLTPVTVTTVEGADGKKKTVRQGGKKNGVMLSPATLERELGYTKSDWEGIKYIVSEKEGMTLDAIAEMIYEDGGNNWMFPNMDTMQIKDEIINFLQGISTYAEIRDYIENERRMMAEEEADVVSGAKYAEADMYAQSQGMTVDEYNEWVIQQARETREKWLEAAENPEEFAKFEQSNNGEYEETDNDIATEKRGSQEGAREEDDEDTSRGADTVGTGDGAAVDGAETSKEEPSGEPDGDLPGDDGGPGNGRGKSRGTDRGDEAGDSGAAVVPDDVEASDRGVDELVDEGKQKAEKATADFMDAISAINGKLSDLRRAAAAQREYDKETIQIVTSLADELLEKGKLSDLTRGEIKRLIATLRDSVGRADLTVTFDRLMNLLITNQLRNARERFEEFLKIRGSKVDARGVEVRGKLDVEGQKMMAALKDGLKLDATTLAERISEAEDKLFSESETERRNAEIDLVGYEIARAYMEDVKGSEIEESELRKALKGAKIAYDGGILAKDAYREFVKVTYAAIRENRMARVEAYEALLGKMAEQIKNSIAGTVRMREAEKARIERIHHFANSDMQGMPASAHEEKKNWFLNNDLVRFLLKPFATFDQMLRSFAPKSRNGEGYLWNHFMGGWLKATENEYKGIQKAHEVLDAKVREVFGPSEKRWSDLFSVEKRMAKGEVTFWDDGEYKTREIPQGNLLYIYMVNKMSDGEMKLRNMGITEEDVSAIVDALDPRFIELADWLQEEFLPSMRDKYNAVHEKLFGAPMAAIDNYFPIRVLANARTREVDLGVGEQEGKPSTITGSVIKRTKNALALDILNSDAFDVVLGHIEEMEHWAAFAEWNQDLNTLLSYKKFRNRVQNMSGVYGAGKTVWDNFRATAEIAAGVYRPAVKADSLDKTAINLAKGVTGSKISFRVFTAIKQLLSWPAFLADANWGILAKNFANPVEAWRWSMENLPLFEKRWKSRQAGDSRLMETDADWKVWKNKVVEMAGRAGMTPNAFIDAVTVAIGARSVYETKLKEYLGMGYTQEKAEEKAKRDATVSFNESQQSNESAFLSQTQVDRTVASVLFTIFRNSSMGYQRQYVDALRNISHMMKKGYREQSIEYMRKQMVRDGLTEEQAWEAAERIYDRSFTRNALKAITFGFVVQFAWNLGPSLIYMLLGDDDDEKKKAATDAAVRALVGGPVEGMIGGQLLSNVLGNLAMGEGLANVNGVQLPAVSDLKNIQKLLEIDKVRAANEVFNLLVSSGIGVNPQTFTDIAVAIIDAANGDLETSTEITLALLRILQVPQSQIEKLYMDEIDMKADEAFDLTVQEFAERYAKYKKMRNAGVFTSAYSDEESKKRENKAISQFTTKADEARRTRGSELAQQFFEYYDNEYEEVEKTLADLKRDARNAAINQRMEEAEQISQMLNEYVQGDQFGKYAKVASAIKTYEAYKKLMKAIDDIDAKEEYARHMVTAMEEAVKLLDEIEASEQ